MTTSRIDVRADGRRTIAFSHAVSELLVVRAVRAYADRRAAELGGIEMLHGDTIAGDLGHQLAEVAAWIERGVDAIVVMPIDAAALAPLVDRAHARGIRVLSYAFALAGSDGEAGFDSVLSGRLCGAAAADFIRTRFPGGGAHALVASLEVTPLFAPRWQEPIAAIEAAGGTVVAVRDGATVEVGRAVTAEVLRAYPELSVVVGLNDEFALGAAEAFAAAGRDPEGVFICGQDGGPEALRAIARGGHLKGTAAILLDELGAAIVDMSLAAIAGLPATVRVPAEYLSLADPARLATRTAVFDRLAG